MGKKKSLWAGCRYGNAVNLLMTLFLYYDIIPPCVMTVSSNIALISTPIIHPLLHAGHEEQEGVLGVE